MISPDDDMTTDDPLNGLEDEEAEGKAALDDSEAGAGDEDVPRALQKVELDLDDAPFLEEEDEEEEEEDFESEEEDEEKPEKKRISLAALLKNPKVLIGISVLLLLVIGVLVKMLLFTGPEAPPKEKLEVPPKETPVAQEEPKEPEVKEFPIIFDPFWVEKEQTNGTVRFIHCQFSVTTYNTSAKREIQLKMLVLRDAVFYYLKNKDFAFLADTSNMDELKKDILAVINKYLGQTQLETIFVKQYLVQ
jgi:flagellar FliL protein